MDWSASQYLRFEDERTRPAKDLLAGVPNVEARRVIDIGCGPGNSTKLLAERYPLADVAGLDTSPAMLERAQAEVPNAKFERADIATWKPLGTYDVVLGNAVLQWLPDHRSIFPQLLSWLSLGGSLAIQMPDNLDEPSHVAMREVSRLGTWSTALEAADRERAQILNPQTYYGLLAPLCRRVEIWRTVYHHSLADVSEIVEWFKSTGLRPYLKLLDERSQVAFLNCYLDRIQSSYPVQSDGRVLLAFPRLFIVATR